MYVSKLQLVDFRSYSDVVVEFTSGVTTLVGRNGVGKTNIVEGIGYAGGLSSHRVATDAPLIRSGAERALVRVEVHRDDRAQLIEIEITAGKANRARLNRNAVSRARDVVGVLRTVMFAPEDLSLVKGDPAERRKFLDDLVVLQQPRMAGVKADYDRVLKQRNSLLKSAMSARGSADVAATLDVWNTQLASLGSQLLSARAHLLAELLPPASESYRTLAPGGGELALSITGSVSAGADAEEQLLAAMAARRSEELARGVTLVGPHRDDLVIGLGEHPAKGYASHGESWSCALALRLGSYHLLRRADDGGDPVLILDDVFAELDAGRRRCLAEMVADAEQVIVTAAVDDDVPEPLRGARLAVEPGIVTRVAT